VLVAVIGSMTLGMALLAFAPKDGERGQKGGWRSRREEQQRDRDRQEAVDREIIPFKGVADDRRDDLRLR
jgi:hypothetical protein